MVKERKITVIGANSFLAKKIRQLSGDNLHLFHKKSDPNYWYPGSCFQTNFDVKKILDSNIIFYCAGAGIQPKNKDSVSLIYELNCMEPIRLISLLEEAGYEGTLITFGSYFEIGSSPVGVKYNESLLVGNKNIKMSPYSVSKSLFTYFLSNKISNSAFQLLHFILPNIYGLGEDDNRLFPYINFSIANNKEMTFTSANQIRQFLHVKDVAKFLLSVDSTRSGIYNLGTKSCSVKDAIRLAISIFEKYYDKEARYKFSSTKRNDIHMDQLVLDDDAAQNELNWSPEIDLDRGLDEYCQDGN